MLRSRIVKCPHAHGCWHCYHSSTHEENMSCKTGWCSDYQIYMNCQPEKSDMDRIFDDAIKEINNKWNLLRKK